MSICLSVTFLHFHFQNHWASFNQTGTKHLWEKEIQVWWNEGPRSFTRGDNIELENTHWRHLRIFSRATGPVSTKLNAKHTWTRENQVWWNEEPDSFPRGDNRDIVNTCWRRLTIYFSEAKNSQYKQNLVQNILGWKKFNLFKLKATWNSWITLMIFKIFFSRSTGLISNKLTAQHNHQNTEIKFIQMTPLTGGGGYDCDNMIVKQSWRIS